MGALPIIDFQTDLPKKCVVMYRPNQRLTEKMCSDVPLERNDLDVAGGVDLQLRAFAFAN
jgi:hypothetical protein